MRRASLVILVVFAAGACAASDESNALRPPDTPVWNAETAWRLSDLPVVEVRPNEERQRTEGTPLDPVAVFRQQNGNYVIADGNTYGWHSLLVYDSLGTLVRTLGRKGEGPAEFKQLYHWAGEYRGDTIAGYDGSLRRRQLWTADGEFVRTERLPGAGLPVFLGDGFIALRPMPDIGLLKRLTRRGSITGAFRLHRPDGSVGSTLLSYSESLSRVATQEVPNYQDRRIFAGGRSHFYAAEWTEFSVAVYDTVGTLVHTLRRSLPPEPFSNEEKEEVIAVRMKAFGMGPEGAGDEVLEELEKSHRNKGRWPKNVPALDYILEDSEGNVWVRHYYFVMAPHEHPADGRSLRWSVFDPAGTFLGEVIMPPRFLARTITRDRVMGFWTDDEGLQHMHAYALLKPSDATIPQAPLR